jgi:Ca2+-binding EF-hand superfamily protein
VDYVNNIDMDEVVTSSVLNTEKDYMQPLVEYESGLSVDDSVSQPPSVMSMLKHFQVINEAGSVTYPHFLDTVKTWGRKEHIARRVKFIDMLSPVQLDSFQSLFRVIDRDEDGLIDMFDFRAVLDSVKVDEEEEEIDPDSQPRLGLDGFKKMTSDEFIGIAAEAEFYHLLADTFKDMDAEGNGYVRVDDVSELLHSLKSICTSFDCDAKLNDLINGKADEEVDARKYRYVYYKNFIASLLEMNC